MEKLIDESMIDICKGEGVPHKQVFFLLFFAVGFTVISIKNYCVQRIAFENTRVYFPW